MSEAGSYLDVKVRRLDRRVADRQVAEYVGGDRIADAAQRRDALLRHRNLIRLGLMTGAGVIDLLVIFAAALLAAAIRQGDLGSNNWMQSLGVLAPTYMLAAMAFGAYRMRRLSSFSRSSPSRWRRSALQRLSAFAPRSPCRSARNSPASRPPTCCSPRSGCCSSPGPSA